MSLTGFPALASYWPLVDRIATDHQVQPALVGAVALAESACQPAHFYRFEPKFYSRYHLEKNPRYRAYTAERCSASYGPMQIMFVTAVELGFSGEPEQLFVPETSFDWGTFYLAQCLQWADGFGQEPHKTVQAALCAYNAGRNSLTSPMTPRPPNIAYALRVLRLADQIDHGA